MSFPPPTPKNSDLDANQVLKGAYNEAAGRLRVDAVINPAGGQTEVAIDHTDDSIVVYGVDQIGTHQAIKTSENGEVRVNGVYNATTNIYPSNSGFVAQVRNAVSSLVRQILQLTAIRGSVDTDAVSLDVSIHDGLGNKYTDTNPLPVKEVSSSSGGTPRFDYKSVVNLGSNLTDDHILNVVGTTFRVKQIIAASSGLIKVDLLAGPIGFEVPIVTAFNPSAGLPVDLGFKEDLDVPVGQRIILRILNREGVALNVYSTILGEFLP